MRFSGFPEEAFRFYERLAADNSRTFWQANKTVYERSVRDPMVALTEALAEHGPFHIFRPNRDVRFDKDKSPYKEHVAAYSESEAGAGYYVQLGAAGMFAGCGYYDMATDQLQRFRNAIVEAGTGDELVGLCAAAERSGVRLGAMRELKTAPRGYPKDHPRIELLRRKGLIVSQDWPLATWMHSDKVVARIRAAWESAAEIIEWLNTHVGPSTLPPDDAFGH